MSGIAVITHGKFAEGLKQSVNMISGQHDHFGVLGLKEGQEMADFKKEVWELISELDNGDGVLVFVDMFGATPFNTVSMLRNDLLEAKIKTQLFAGVNLPVVLEALTLRWNLSLSELVSTVKASAKDSFEALNVSDEE